MGDWKCQLQLDMSSHKYVHLVTKKMIIWGKQKGRTIKHLTLMHMKLKRSGNSSCCAGLRQPLILTLSTSFWQCQTSLIQGFLQNTIVKVMHIFQCVILIASSWLLFVCFSMHTMKIHIKFFPFTPFCGEDWCLKFSCGKFIFCK